MITSQTEALALGIRHHVSRETGGGVEYPELRVTYGEAGPLNEPWSVKFAIGVSNSYLRGGKPRWKWATVEGRTIMEALDRARARQVAK